MTDHPQHALVLNDLSLLDESSTGEFSISTLGEDFTFGNPVPVETVMTSLMLDGASVVRTSDNNREVSFQVEVSAPDSIGLAAGEAALVAEMNKRGTLTWTPPDGLGAPTVFTVVTGSIDFLFNDIDELRLRWTFRIRLVCLPFGRSVDKVKVGSDSVADAVTIADDCQSTTGWAPMAGKSGQGYTPTFAVDSTAGNFVTGTGAIKVQPDGTRTATEGFYQSFTAFSKVLSIAATSGYLVFALKATWTGTSPNSPVIQTAFITTSGGGRQAVTFLNVGAVGNGFSRFAAAIPHNSTITLLEVEVWQSSVFNIATQPPLWVDSIGTAATATTAQKARTFDVVGSARTEGTFEVASPANVAGLGDVLLYTTPDRGDGFRPDLRRWQVGGTSTPDTQAINATYANVTGTAVVMQAPLTSFRPGAYAVLARIRQASGATAQVTVTAQMFQGATAVGGIESTDVTAPLSTNADYEIVRVGVLHLPPTVVDDNNSTAVIRFSVTTSAGVAIRLDELLVFPMEEAALTWVKCGTGSPSALVASRLWLDGPSIQYPRGRVMVGTTANRSDARSPRPISRGSHLLYPGMMLSYLLASGTTAATLTATYPPAWHTHAKRLTPDG